MCVARERECEQGQEGVPPPRSRMPELDKGYRWRESRPVLSVPVEELGTGLLMTRPMRRTFCTIRALMGQIVNEAKRN